MKIKIKKLRNNATIPTLGSLYAAGNDLYACLDEAIVIKPHHTVMIPTGIAIELLENTVGYVFSRSGLASKNDLALANKVGVVDADYRGEIFVPLHNHGLNDQTVTPNMRIAQLVVMEYIPIQFEEVAELTDSVRGEKGFGSSGK